MSRRAHPATGPRRGAIAFKCGDWLCLGRPDGSGTRRLLPARFRHPFPQWERAFSPDGTRLAFRGYFGSSEGDYALYVARADGCSPRRLTQGASNPSWSPDGAWIAFDTSGGGPLRKIHPDGSGLTRIDTGLPGDHDISPTWSPDGASIAFVHEDRLDRGEIWSRATRSRHAPAQGRRQLRRVARVVAGRQADRVRRPDRATREDRRHERRRQRRPRARQGLLRHLEPGLGDPVFSDRLRLRHHLVAPAPSARSPSVTVLAASRCRRVRSSPGPRRRCRAAC